LAKLATRTSAATFVTGTGIAAPLAAMTVIGAVGHPVAWS
jgi:hypothetical protein